MQARPLPPAMATAAALLVAAALASGATAPAHAESTSCTLVTSVPTTLGTAGRYCLAQDFTFAGSSGRAIHITANDVELDCNDHRIRATTAGNVAQGIVASDAQRTRIRNCVLDEFDVGIGLYNGPGGHRIQGNHIVRPGRYGLWLDGGNHLIEGNRISGSRGYSGTVYPDGIHIAGAASYSPGVVIRNNVIGDMRPDAPTNAGSAGISLSNLQNAIIEGNVITALRSRTGAGSYGIISSSAFGMAVRGNTILTPVAPGTAPWDGGNYRGIFLQGTVAEQGTNVCADNVVGHFNTNITGCVVVTSTGF